MNEIRRSCLRAEIEEIARMRDRIDRIRDGEVRSGPEGCVAAVDCLNEASQALLIVTGMLLKAKRC